MVDNSTLFRNRITGYDNVAPQTLTANLANFRRHPPEQEKALAGALSEIGWLQDVIVNRMTGRILDGHLRVELALKHNQPSVPVKYVELSEAEENLALATLDAITGQAVIDPAALSALLGRIEMVNVEDDGLASLLGQMAQDVGLDSDEPNEEGEPSLTRADVPDALWPTDNDYGVPLLDIRLQAKAFDQPAQIWGTKAGRKVRMSGTWLFYTEDYRFEALWSDPSPVLNTGAVAAVEPNFSAYSNMPMAVALWQIYRKRWIARWWQQYGLPVWVDLNVAENHAELNLCGVPDGWTAFATRGYTERLDATHREYELAQRKAGDRTPLFLVYGGGKAVKAECGRMGWLWMQEDMDTAKGREV